MVTKLGPFQVLEVIGRGGMGTVYRAIDPIIGRPVAVKVIRMLGYNDGDEQTWLRGRLFQEARAAGSLCHPAIVTIYQVGEDHDVAYIAMEFVDGPTLAEIMTRAGPPDFAMLLRILNETAAALDFAHQRGIVHRDIKPANIMTTAAGATKVTDFGIAKTMLGQTATKTGLVLGTPFYMSPEQIRGQVLDGRSDQFALAAIAYEIFTGRRPFQADQMTSVCYQVLHEEPLSPEDLNPEIGGQMAEILKKGLAKDFQARYSTCIEFTQALTAALQSGSGRHAAKGPDAPWLMSVPDEVGPPSRIQSDRRPAVNKRDAMLILSAVVAVVTVLGYTAVRNSSSRHHIDNSDEVRHSGSTDSKSVSADQKTTSGVKASPATQDKSTSRESLRPDARRSVIPSETTVRPDKRQSQESITHQGIAHPSRGIIVWTGHTAAGGLLVFAGSQASSGSVLGAFPGGHFNVEVYPAEGTAAELTAFTVDPRYVNPLTVASSSGTVTFVYDPRHATDISIFELPSMNNNWARLAINARKPLSRCVIRWSSIDQ